VALPVFKHPKNFTCVLSPSGSCSLIPKWSAFPLLTGNPENSGLSIHLCHRLSSTSNGTAFAFSKAANSDMTLKIERFSEKRGSRIRLSGELRYEQLTDVRSEIERDSQRVILDLNELDLVDVHAVRFLNACEDQNVKVVNCAPYIREWMFQERINERDSERT
jgi:hypothetical protein